MHFQFHVTISLKLWMVAGACGQNGQRVVLTAVVEHEAGLEHVPTYPHQMAERIAEERTGVHKSAMKRNAVSSLLKLMVPLSPYNQNPTGQF